MDVILDSNAYSSDYGMKSARFLALFSFLKKTAGRLVLLKLVRDEVLANYKRDFDEKVRARWDKMRAYAIEESTFQFPDLTSQLNELRNLLESPKNIESVFLKEYRGVTIEETVRRGIERIPPANSKGEEIRDVVLWLAVVGHAKQEKTKVAFITSDSGFWAEDSDEPRTQIQNDIAEGSVDIRLYRSIEAFLAENVLVERALSSDRALSIFANANLGDFIVSKAVPAEFPASAIVSSSIPNVRFESGSLYDVGNNAEFAECTFVISVEVQMKGAQNVLLSNPAYDHRKWADLWMQEGQQTVVFQLKNVPTQDWESWLNTSFGGTTTRTARLDVHAKVSIRLSNGAITGVSLDTFRVTNIEFVPASSPKDAKS